MKKQDRDNEGENQWILQDLNDLHRFESHVAISSHKVWFFYHENMMPYNFLMNETLLDVWLHCVIDMFELVFLLLHPKLLSFYHHKKQYLLQLGKINNNEPNFHVFLMSIEDDDQQLTKLLLIYHLHKMIIKDRRKKNLLIWFWHYELWWETLILLLNQNQPPRILKIHHLKQIREDFRLDWI